MNDSRQLVGTIVEPYWSDGAGLERLRALATEDYGHHPPIGDWNFDQFRAGVEWIDGRTGERSDRAEQVLAERRTRRDDSRPVDRRGAYHCRLRDGRVCEDLGPQQTLIQEPPAG